MGMPELQEGDLFRVGATVAFACLVPIVLYLLERFLGPKPALDADKFLPFRLIKKESLSHDTRRFTFALPGPKIQLGLPIGQHIALRFAEKQPDGTVKRHQRSYTPTTGNETPGRVEFVIKVYQAGVHPKFPAGGKLSQHLDGLKIGDHVEMKGPKGEGGGRRPSRATPPVVERRLPRPSARTSSGESQSRWAVASGVHELDLALRFTVASSRRNLDFGWSRVFGARCQ